MKTTLQASLASLRMELSASQTKITEMDIGFARSVADCAQAQAKLVTTRSKIEDLQANVRLQARVQGLDS